MNQPNFSGFLKQLRMKYGFTAAKDLFAHLGEQESLGMSLRNFQLLESGQQAPTTKAFIAIFERLERDDYRSALTSFFQSQSENNVEGPRLREYLNDHLTEAFNKTEKSIWNSNKQQTTYSESQMTFLTQNPEAMRIHHKSLLFEYTPLSELKEKKRWVDELIQNELAVIDGKNLRPFRLLVRTPNFENAAPSTVRKANRMLLSHIENYASLEGGDNQEMSYAIQLVSERTASVILDEMRKFKKWVQSLAADSTKGPLRPFVMVNFGKKLKERELQ